MNTNTLAIIDKVGNKLEGIAEYAWPILVKEQFILGITSAVLTFIMILISIFTMRVGLKIWNRDNSDDSGGIALIIFGGLLSFFIAIAVLSESGGVINQIFNPEAAAINKLIKK